ncbi:amino acid ABC transporter permease [Acetobacter nitrogenifigens DSM 23921 = NBRC 105050]|uniref:Glutamate/aspartate import permease protein GltK n=1 Tax=Acetobacter nitrogenifigens DSM 23921 = NBRC 105050 TaxID=1120919 RepID=A0A511X8M9_9PROT|nr:amino acid ABC transporter permease [Acetobacter nitrogenifigens]GBQ87595.1 amino acid ABC transporter permease [Acetobacter nitrogenifigens DSM 23921 = NBRC 105050]GEN59307.1 ABC transporter permease [Acetobacter nitrogenifigens DSM 23921 = NBRC 105050]
MTGSFSYDFAEEAERLCALPVRRRPAWGHIVSATLIVVVCAWIVRAFALGQIEWRYVGAFLFAPSILRGLGATLLMSACAMALGLVVGLGLAVGRLSSSLVPRWFSIAYIWLFRGVPVILQLLVWFNLALIFPHVGLPGLGEVRTVDVMTPFLSALLGLGLNQAAYIGEILRGGLQSIDRGQYEAAEMIGMTRGVALRRIILPQAMRVVIPPLGNEFINMIKLTSLASMIQYPEILHNAENIYYANTRVMELLIVAGFWYLMAVTVLSPLQHLLERRVSRGSL